MNTMSEKNIVLDREELIGCIHQLKGELVGLGYNCSEVNYIVQKYAGGEISQMPLKKLWGAKRALHSHLQIAQKCISVK